MDVELIQIHSYKYWLVSGLHDTICTTVLKKLSCKPLRRGENYSGHDKNMTDNLYDI